MKKDEIKNCVCECVKWNEWNKVTQCHRCGRIAERPTVTMKEIENAVGDTSDEYTEGVVELFEFKGFVVDD